MISTATGEVISPRVYIQADNSLYLATYSVDPKTLTISNGGQVLLNKAADHGFHPITMTAGRFTSEPHQQLIIGSQLQDGSNLIVQSIDFDAVTIQPQLIATWNTPDAGSSVTFKLKAGRFELGRPHRSVELALFHKGQRIDLESHDRRSR